MSLPLPASFHSAFSADRLGAIASRLLEVRHDTLRTLSTDLDDSYVQETAVFGRSRNMLIGMALNSQYPWLNLSHAGLDVTAEIVGVPFRFFRDDPGHPEKSGFFKRNAVDDLFAPDDSAPVLWRFVVERAEMEEEEDQVHFVGYNIYGDRVSQWTYSGQTGGLLASVGQDIPPTMPLPLPAIELLPEEGREGEQDRPASTT